MNTTAKIQHKGQVTIPTSVRRQAGLSKGDLVNFSFSNGKIVITPRIIIDRAQFPTADDEYTPAQRRAIDRQLAKGLADIKAGRVHGPFNTSEDLLTSLHAESKKLQARKPNRRVK